MAGQKVSQSQCAAVFGVHRNTIANWLKQGCPFDQKANKPQGKDWILDTAKVAQWREQKAVIDATGDTEGASEEELKKRKLAAETSSAEMDLMERRGELIRMQHGATLVSTLLVVIRQALLQQPQRIAPLLVGIDDELVIKELIETENHEVLRNLSDGDSYQEAMEIAFREIISSETTS